MLQRLNARPFTASRPACRPVLCQAAASEGPARPTTARKAHPSLLTQAPPEKYAVVELAGTQLFVEEGKWYTVNRLAADVGSKIKLGRVLFMKNGKDYAVGRPYLETANVRRGVGWASGMHARAGAAGGPS